MFLYSLFNAMIFFRQHNIFKPFSFPFWFSCFNSLSWFPCFLISFWFTDYSKLVEKLQVLGESPQHWNISESMRVLNQQLFVHVHVYSYDIPRKITTWKWFPNGDRKYSLADQWSTEQWKFHDFQTNRFCMTNYIWYDCYSPYQNSYDPSVCSV